VSARSDFLAEIPLAPPPGQLSLASAVNLGSLGLLTWGVTGQAHPGLHGDHLVALVLQVGAVASWVMWLLARALANRALQLGAVLAMALIGGGLTAFAPLAVVFPAVGVLGAAISFPLRFAVVVAGVGSAAMGAAVAGAGEGSGVFFGGLAATFAGVVLGISRKEAAERAEQAARIGVERERAELERGRAELLAERNRLARELHDVLAHTLSALSLQLEVLGTVVESSANEPPGGAALGAEVQKQLDQARQLVHQGLDEASRAVRALREDAVPLPEQLGRLCDGVGARLSVSGAERPLPPEVSFSLYRIAQEGVTNALKHAPGSTVSVCLDFSADAVRIDVENGAATKAAPLPAVKGSGYGLQGIAERVALVGGKVETGPHGDGWRVSAEVPVPA